MDANLFQVLRPLFDQDKITMVLLAQENHIHAANVEICYLDVWKVKRLVNFHWLKDIPMQQQRNDTQEAINKMLSELEPVIN